MLTSLYAAILTALFLALTYNVIRLRLVLKVGLGDGDNTNLRRAIRMHGNFAEFVPFALLLMMLAEMQHVPAWAIHGLGMVLVLGRVLHIWGLNRTENASPQRFLGTVMTHLALLGGAVACFWGYLGGAASAVF